ncbi:hypothetical protein AB9P05_17925 [Roseivirga sp. BDSF3-8]|uniref:hypothetical protein n=1 Tax=Roseivirga sp. BDSF3-8 TaxID=3241598 RepID=UPI003531874B
MKKHTARASMAVIFLLQVAFLGAIVMEKTNLPVVLSMLAFIGVSIVIAWRNITRHTHDHLWQDIWLVGYVAFGAVLTYWLSTITGTVIAVGVVGVAASFLPSLIKKAWVRSAPSAIYCGAFVGMTSPAVLPGYTFILLAGAAAGLLLVASKNIFNGYGGKLGTIAFGGVFLVVLLIEWLWH